ncbi:hypothetical protein FSU_1806 [Fibrobacter succinogenes subsp. succinogenes S85]|uniref:Uncharacterized protein n=2 Tax=Fibrobacter succinogenes (strain ATCC 19169 / S85) TaxID=59374 RepID=D9SB60_FIBSS|nr:hypothetical protein FSU_1806 [Fibrobacter succinogenes subsp. succinogenes S85]
MRFCFYQLFDFARTPLTLTGRYLRPYGGFMAKSEDLIRNLLSLPHEYEWLDIKGNWFSKEEIGEV